MALPEVVIARVGRRGAGILAGSGVPSNTLGRNGDFYVDTTAHKWYGPKAEAVWPAGVSLIGPTGPSGAALEISTTTPQAQWPLQTRHLRLKPTHRPPRESGPQNQSP